MRWTLDSLFRDFAAFTTFRSALAAELAAALEEAQSPTPPSLQTLGRQLVRFEDLSARAGHANCWLECRAAADTSDESIRMGRAAFAEVSATLERLSSALKAHVGTLDEAGLAALLREPGLPGAEHTVRELWKRARSLMSPAEEDLAAVLGVDGFHAWGRLYDTLTGRMVFDLTQSDGSKKSTPISRRRALMADPVRSVRRAAFVDGQAPFIQNADALAAALNGIAGTRLKLYARRGGQHYLDGPLLDAALSRPSLEAMQRAIIARAPKLREALKAAARRQGTEALSFYDLEAPQVAAPADTRWDWDTAVATLRKAFRASYPALADYFEEMLSKQWIEAEARGGKKPGAFCTSSPVAREERVYMTHNDTINDVVTLAHEVGHAWHSAVLRPERPFRMSYPMTLAETASNVAEIVLLNGMLADPALPPSQKLFLLDQAVLRASGYLLNIPMRFEFECRFYEERALGEVPPERLCELMRQAQRTLYGEALQAGEEDPYFWASKLHFFITEVSFYNFPYAFGYLLANAIGQRIAVEGPSFLTRYEAFLRASGAGTCEEVCLQTLGFDITQDAFWQDAVEAACKPLEAYVKA